MILFFACAILITRMEFISILTPHRHHSLVYFYLFHLGFMLFYEGEKHLIFLLNFITDFIEIGKTFQLVSCSDENEKPWFSFNEHSASVVINSFGKLLTNCVNFQSFNKKNFSLAT